MSFICHIHNYTEYNEEWNVFSAFNPSKWNSGQPTVRRPGSSSVPCSRVSPQSWTLPAGARIRTHNLGLLRVSSPTLYPLGHYCPQTTMRCGRQRLVSIVSIVIFFFLKQPSNIRTDECVIWHICLELFFFLISVRLFWRYPLNSCW